MKEFFLIVLGFGLCALIVARMSFAQWLSARPRRSRMTGAYRDATKPFVILAPGPAHGPERSDELIARTARRGMHKLAPEARAEIEDFANVKLAPKRPGRFRPDSSPDRGESQR